jgi:sucrose-6-phosphate hydrolase SacC (GH32 family)
MRKLKLIGIICPVFLFITCNSPVRFKDAVAAWSLSDLNDMTPENSQLKSHGEVLFVTLGGNDAKASKERGGDGIAARLKGAWLDAGQGADEELNLTGKHVSILLRMKADTVKGFVPLVNKSGNDQNLAYSISLNIIGNDVSIESLIGSDDIGGAHLLKYKLPETEITKWHDILFRFNGRVSELFVDGLLRDDEITVGEVRDWNNRPFLIGAEYEKPFGYADVTDSQVKARFEGLIDHVALWNRYLSDEEVRELSGVKELKDGRPEYYKEKYRPQFHFTAKKNWLNDPNGLFYYNGVYHMFFQYMPPHRPGAYKDWGHAVSEDLIHWEQTLYPITPHKVWAGCWSGSAVVDLNNSAGFQTGKEKTIVAFITNGGNPQAGIGPLCTQCIAYSTDGGQSFKYYDQNPVIGNINNSNRDPKVVWDEGSKKWIMSIYMDKASDFGLFSSVDLKEWKYLTTVSLDGVAECPGFEAFPVDGNEKNKKWLFFGANGNYMIGSFNGTSFKPETKVIRGDWGRNFYAAQIWNNVPDGRAIHIAWMPTERYPDMPFEQQMNFPAELTLKTTSEGIRVFRVPVREIRNLYNQESLWNNIILKEGINLFKDLHEDLYDFNIDVEPGHSSSFEIGIRGAAVHYDVVRRIISCGGPTVKNRIVNDSRSSDIKSDINFSNNLGEAPLAPDRGRIKLRILVDRTTIEVFGNDGEIVITSCFMPEEDNTSYSLTSTGESKIINAEVHSLKSAWGN